MSLRGHVKTRDMRGCARTRNLGQFDLVGLQRKTAETVAGLECSLTFWTFESLSNFN